MDLVQAVLLALLQGVTEFLPVSSSAHLILLPALTGWEDQGLAFDVAVHVGTLAAVVWYFRGELRPMIVDWGRSLLERRLVGESRLAWGVLFGTVPVGVAGLAFKDVVETSLRSPLVIAATTIIFGVLLWWADARGQRLRSEHTVGWKDVLVIGVAQAIALIPGTSRSGITMTAGLMMGLDRQGAARFSFLLSIPVIAIAGGLSTVELIGAGESVIWTPLLVGTAVAALSAYLCIHFFLKLLERIGMMPFVIYRLLLGGALLAVYA
ncbi:undecaprenyl-diphosphate phosphatase [Thiohalomonas denitrificans]|uniref:Undecaprenyl-diphosphatase n=1 Tax=Thiohalomonas denitrificans TaxID=415747 RepID=A0A1G5PST1_9GAMM|nr:undecaprenyl-diphosphate phosphatase [Thiohalomonas denitrificans]SCZ52553.1 undecaprenyl-diphosphatase [Thiohalomonas denitrificans]